MDEIPLSALFGLLVLLLALSAFFSGSETGLMTMNRYRLKTRAQKGERGARLASQMLARPDRLIGTILLGNNFINTLAASVATLIGLRLFPGETGIAVATGALTLLLLIFGAVWGIFSRPIPLVPDRAALVVAPQGPLVGGQPDDALAGPVLRDQLDRPAREAEHEDRDGVDVGRDLGRGLGDDASEDAGRLGRDGVDALGGRLG